MENKSGNAITISNDTERIGTVQIADDVVAMIASLAATEVDGVSSMVGNITNELMSKVGMKKLTKGVKVDILETNVSVDLAIMLEYGYNIPSISQKVQEKVKTAVESMTGLMVTDVNVRIAGVNMAKGK
ncbi:MAG: Asp23/Gls24 family envelope stress response protein [Lachnospiraceae bacterium]